MYAKSHGLTAQQVEQVRREAAMGCPQRKPPDPPECFPKPRKSKAKKPDRKDGVQFSEPAD